MPSNVAPAQDGNEIAPPPNPSQGHQGSDPGEPAIATTPFTIKEAKQARLSGRGFRRLVSLCRTVTQLVAEYDRHLLASGPDADSDIDNDNDNEDHSPERREEIRRLVQVSHDCPTYIHSSPGAVIATINLFFSSSN
jgi:hypothetical protein